MNNIKVTGTNGVSTTIEYTNGDNLMEVLREAGYDEIAAMCGGCCSCATCHVHLADQAKFALPAIEENEEMLLEMADEYDKSNSRLSCQIILNDEQAGLSVQIIEPD